MAQAKAHALYPSFIRDSLCEYACSRQRHMNSMKRGVLTFLLLLFYAEASAQEAGTCEPGEASAYLKANNVRAGIYNAGQLFWGPTDGYSQYRAPRNGGISSVFAASLWVGGLVGSELRFAGTDYGPFEYFPGPLTDDGMAPNPNDCSAYDRIFSVTQLDLDDLDATGIATADIRDWPWHLGAPVTDGDGDPHNYDLDGGDRPEITGHQMLWWIMNDVAGPHEWGNTDPLGIEVAASSFAWSSTEPALNNTTFYRYWITNKQAHTIDSVHVAMWMDADIGNAGDDYVGADTTLGMGFFYNGDDLDEGEQGYGARPPALGYNVLQGALADNDAVDNDRDGEVDEPGERLGSTAFMIPYRGSSEIIGFGGPAWFYMQARWPSGRPLTLGEPGYGGTDRIRFIYAGDPVEGRFWSEEQTGAELSRNAPGDRRGILSSGPFTLPPGATEEIVFAIVWARGDDRLDSITELRAADRVVQDFWDSGDFGSISLPAAPEAGPALVSPADGVGGQPTMVDLAWRDLPYASEYAIDVGTTPSFNPGTFKTLGSYQDNITVGSLAPNTDVYWRVRAASPLFHTPNSPVHHFRTSDVRFHDVGVQMVPGTETPAFLEIVGPGGIDPCGPDAMSTDGCEEAGGNLVYMSHNATGEYLLHPYGGIPEESLEHFAPNDFDIRFTSRGSYAIHLFGMRNVTHVPFEVWDVGPVGFFNENDPSDDVQMIPVLLADDGDECTFGYGEIDDPMGLGLKISDRVYAYYPKSSYAEWEDVVGPLVENSYGRCKDGGAHVEMLDLDRGRPIQRLVFLGDPEVGSAPGEGTVIRFYTTPEPSEPPIPAAPAAGAGPVPQPFSLHWSAQRGTYVRYQLQIAPDAGFADPVVDSTTSELTMLVGGLGEGVTYFWRVRMAHPESPWSEAWSFTAGEVTNVAAARPADLPQVLTLDQNYPNPFNPSTTIRFGLPEAGPTRVTVFDVLGRQVAVLLDGMMAAGWHDVTYDGSMLASGMYVYVVEHAGRRESRTLILLK